MKLASRMIAGTVASMLVFAFSTCFAYASSEETPLACTGLPSHANPTENAGAGSTQCESTDAQPLSNADMNGHGANDPTSDNPYLATGFGQVQGGHLAGTEGRADNKFPPGQAPNGTDSNHGYECDQNPGVGNGNPAHTTCLSTQSVTPPGGESHQPPSGGNETPPPRHETTPPGGEVKPVTSSQSPPLGTETPPSNQLGEILVPPTTPAFPATIVAPPAPATRRGGTLPFTGDRSRVLTVIGMILIAVGAMAVRLTEERPLPRRH
jgi:hypothetical protein